MEISVPRASAPEYAGFWMRFLAYIIDAIIAGIASGIVVVPAVLILGVGAAAGMSAAPDEMDEEAATGFAFAAFGLVILVIIAVTVIQWLYFALMESSSKQATVGKMVLGLEVTDLEGHRISFGRATGRYFGKILSGAIFSIGYIMAGFTQQKQALHDILAGCLVVKH
jgi:uncharacterized RDD family membrane protein YckC